jgi:hypothetical protein
MNLADLRFGEGLLKDTEAQRANELARIQANLTLMIGHKCTMPEITIDPLVYAQPAMKCASAKRANIATSEEPCDRKNWRPDVLGLK